MWAVFPSFSMDPPRENPRRKWTGKPWCKSNGITDPAAWPRTAGKGRIFGASILYLSMSVMQEKDGGLMVIDGYLAQNTWGYLDFSRNYPLVNEQNTMETITIFNG